MIRIVIGMKPKGPTEVAKNLEKYRDILHARVKNTVQEFGRRLVSTAKDKYLSGPRPNKLGVVTGRLRNSINAIMTELTMGRDTKAVQLRFGTNVLYAKLHELGLSRKMTHVFGRKLKRPVTAKYPARPFLAPSLKDNKKWLGEQVRVALREMKALK